jgi:predicted  nucleic acid-binding Zn-ribbon protein
MPEGQSQDHDNQQYASIVEIRAYAQAEFRRLREEVGRIFEIIDEIRSAGAASNERLSSLRMIVESLPSRVQKLEQAFDEIDVDVVHEIVKKAIDAAFQQRELTDLRNRLEHVDSSPEQRVKQLERERVADKTVIDEMSTKVDTLIKTVNALKSALGSLKLKFSLIVGAAAIVGAKLLDGAFDYVGNLLNK